MSPAQLHHANDSLTLLQLTDTHLYADASADLQGINTRDSLNAVVDQIVRQPIPFDAIICTGDIAQDHTSAAYQRFIDAIRVLDVPCFWIPGNHDSPIRLKAVDQMPIQVSRQVVTDHWQLVLLDSHAGPVPHGRLDDDELGFLEQALTHYPDKPTLVFVHHNPVLVGSAWLDQHRLRNGEELLQLMARFPQSKGVVWGHVHQAFDSHYQGIRLLSTPSTCVQFKPGCLDYTLDEAQPGYRFLQLRPDGQIITDVHRLPAGSFLPDPDAGGY